MTSALPPVRGLRATVSHVVQEADTASALGSGDVPVLGTPRLLALAEQASCRAVEDAMESGQSSVGTHVELAHLAPSAVGERVDVHAELVEVDGVTLRFEARAEHPHDGKLVAQGRLIRVIVDRTRFLARAGISS
jgi:fluoroacetyl-CoA thioesterase